MTAKSAKKPKIRIAKRRTPFATIEEAVAAIRAGEMVVVVDDEDRENEGDLTIAAEKITPKVINFMATHGRGLICMPMTAERLDELELPLMVNQNTTPFKTAFCVSIEAKHSVSTGISASDRAATVLAAIDAKTKPSVTSKSCTRLQGPFGCALVRRWRWRCARVTAWRLMAYA